MTPTALKNLRRALSLNQSQMADALGLEGEHAWRFLDDLETGKRRITGPVARVCFYLARDAGIADDPPTAGDPPATRPSAPEPPKPTAT